jgi:hypothetical protein
LCRYAPDPNDPKADEKEQQSAGGCTSVNPVDP